MDLGAALRAWSRPHLRLASLPSLESGVVLCPLPCPSAPPAPPPICPRGAGGLESDGSRAAPLGLQGPRVDGGGCWRCSPPGRRGDFGARGLGRALQPPAPPGHDRGQLEEMTLLGSSSARLPCFKLQDRLPAPRRSVIWPCPQLACHRPGSLWVTPGWMWGCGCSEPGGGPCPALRGAGLLPPTIHRVGVQVAPWAPRVLSADVGQGGLLGLQVGRPLWGRPHSV